MLSRGRWDCQAFTAQNDQFVLGVDDALVQWGYKGQRTADAVTDITRDDVHWLSNISGNSVMIQLAAGLRASGGTESEIADFTKALGAPGSIGCGTLRFRSLLVVDEDHQILFADLLEAVRAAGPRQMASPGPTSNALPSIVIMPRPLST